MKACAAWLVLWNDVTPELEAEYNEWHGKEHVPQRLAVPGILTACRYRAQYDNQRRYLTWYGLSGLQVLTSAPYQALLTGPTPWSRRMRPHLLNIERLACLTRLASTDRPGARVCISRPANGSADLTAGKFRQRPMLLGEVDPSVPPLPWASAAGMESTRWIRIENVEDPFPGSYVLLQDFR